MSPNPPQDSAPRPIVVRVGSWLLAPLLGLAAVGLQYQLDVPKGEMVPRPTKEEEARRKREKAKREREKQKAQAARNRGWQARPAARIEILRESWFHQPIEDEPVDKEFRRYHETLVRAAVSIARRQASKADTSPPALRIQPSCHMIRCSVDVCGPPEFVDAVSEYIPEIYGGSGPLWHLFEETEAPPAKTKQLSPTTTVRKDQPEVAAEGGDPTAPGTVGAEPAVAPGKQQPEGSKPPKGAKPKQGEEPEPVCRRFLVSFADDKVARHELRYGEDGEVDSPIKPRVPPTDRRKPRDDRRKPER